MLEPSVPQKFFLSARAARGILRRAERRGRELPPLLHEALLQVAESTSQDEGERMTPTSLPPFEEWIKTTKDLGGTREEWERLREMEKQK